MEGGSGDRQNGSLVAFRMRRHAAIHRCSVSDGFLAEPHWLGRERVSARADVGARSGKRWRRRRCARRFRRRFTSFCNLLPILCRPSCCALCIGLASPGWSRSRMELSILCGVVVWLGGVPMCYLGMINGGYLPAGVSVATTILAPVTFFDCRAIAAAALGGSAGKIFWHYVMN